MSTTDAGRELDARIAERVMGLPRAKWAPVCIVERHKTDDAEYDTGYGWSGWCYHCGKSIRDVWAAGGVAPPRYSTDIAAAWLVVERMIELRWSPIVEYHETPGTWVAELIDDNLDSVREPGLTAPVAICRAALMAVEAPA